MGAPGESKVSGAGCLEHAAASAGTVPACIALHCGRDGTLLYV